MRPLDYSYINDGEYHPAERPPFNGEAVLISPTGEVIRARRANRPFYFRTQIKPVYKA